MPSAVSIIHPQLRLFFTKKKINYFYTVFSQILKNRINFMMSLGFRENNIVVGKSKVCLYLMKNTIGISIQILYTVGSTFLKEMM